MTEFASVLDRNGRFAVFLRNFEGPVLHVALDLGVIKLATNETLGVEDRVLRVHGSLVLGGITNETLLRGESDVGGCRPVALCRK